MATMTSVPLSTSLTPQGNAAFEARRARNGTTRAQQARLDIAAANQQPAPVTEPRVFAHYFPPYPISLDNASQPDYYASQYLRADGEKSDAFPKGKFFDVGGLLRDRPIARAPLTDNRGAPLADSAWRATDAATEVTQAKAAGLDGFLVNLMTTTGSSGWLWSQGIAVAKAAAATTGFVVAPMLDATAGIVDASTDSIVASLTEFWNAAGAAAWKMDGRLVLTTFTAETKSIDWWKTLLASLAAKVGPVAFYPGLQNVDANLAAFAPISVGVGRWGSPSPDTELKADYASVVHAAGVKYMQPVRPQDARPNQGTYAEARNTELWRNGWARAAAADHVQVCTWNDYSESTHIAPSVNHGSTWTTLCKLYADAWRLG